MRDVQIYLITPKKLPDGFADLFAEALGTDLVSAVLVRGGDDDADAYTERAGMLAEIAGGREAALLLEDRPDLVRALGADGAHMTGGKSSFGEAVELLRPQFIVGAGDLSSRHEAMLRGEAGADYLMFGCPDTAPDQEAIDLADWWAEMFEVPCVLCDTVSPVGELGSTGAEFIALGDNVWKAPEGVANALGTAAGKVGA